MNKKIRSLIKALEKEYGCQIQVSVERSKETRYVLETDLNTRSERRVLFPVAKEVYGSFDDRSGEVIPLPTESLEIKHDLELLVGRYNSLRQLNEKIKNIPIVVDFCVHGCDFDKGLRNHLAKKYSVQEKVVGIAHGGKADWYVVDGVESGLTEWKAKRPDLFHESAQYLETSKIPFRYHNLIAVPRGVYITKINDFHYFEELADYVPGADECMSILLKQKIADIKLDLLK